MLIQVLILAVFSTISQAENLDGCGQRPLKTLFNNKIVNGFQAVPGDWGWQVSLANRGRHFCGGVLIHRQWVLSAAHCFQSSNTLGLSVDLGLHDIILKESWSLNRKISTVYVHPQFDFQAMANDIALIKLEKPVVFDDKYIIEACLPDVNLNVEEQTGWATGWGTTRVGGGGLPSSDLMEVSMRILTDTACKEKYGKMVNTDQVICAGVNTGACHGDSGGPFVIKGSDNKWTVVGLTSWGRECGYGTVFTRVTFYLDWINQMIAQN